MAWIGSVIGLVSGASGMAGGIADGQAKAAERSYGSQVARENAKMVSGQSAMQEAAQRRESGQMLGAQRAAIAESGTGFGGSNGLLAAQDAALAELDALNLRYEGKLKRFEYDSQANLLGTEIVGGLQQVLGKRGLGQFSNLYTFWEPLLTGRSGDQSRGR